MNKKFLLAVSLIFIGLLVVGGGIYYSTIKKVQEPVDRDIILSELKRLDIKIVSQPKQIELQLPLAFTDSNWSLKKAVCEEGEYDLSPYAGKSVLLTSYPILEKYENEPLDVWIVTIGDKIVCVYKAVREDSGLAPGVFPISSGKLTCDLNKEYENTAIKPVECNCPNGYGFEAIEMYWGPCPEKGMSDCPASKLKCVPTSNLLNK